MRRGEVRGIALQNIFLKGGVAVHEPAVLFFWGNSVCVSRRNTVLKEEDCGAEEEYFFTTTVLRTNEWVGNEAIFVCLFVKSISNC